jgi:hypothetical protein
MTETLETALEPPRRLQIDWIAGALLSPRRAFARIAAQTSNVWLTPMLVLTITTILRVLVAGWLQAQAVASGMLPTPPEYYTPEQQAQFMQVVQAQQGPVYTYVLPSLWAVLGIWLGWMIVGGLLHLVLTLLGGRGATGASMNIVAWAGLVFAVRDIVRSAYMLITRKLIVSLGISGFAPSGPGDLSLFFGQLMALLDIYIIWHIILIVAGIRAGNGVSRGKALGGALFTVATAILLQALLGLIIAKTGNLNISRPFFF